jgi:hypothetical protein
MSNAWIHFAKSGNPTHLGIPNETSGTMVFDDECAFREHLDDDIQKVMNEA